MIRVSLRASKLSLAQAEELFSDLPVEKTLFPLESYGDQNKKCSLRSLDKSDFFTREIDQAVIEKRCDMAIHSAKDLPEPLPEPLHVIALTEGRSPQDALVLREKELPSPSMVIATSSIKREEALKRLFPKARFIDLRGTIEERLSLLERGEADGLVVAEAALQRLQLSPNRLLLDHKTAPYQGRLAVVARRERVDMEALFSQLDARRRKWLYFGLRVPSPLFFHHPLIEIERKEFSPPTKSPTHLLFTSQTAADLYLPYIRDEVVVSVGKKTASFLASKGFCSQIAEEECQEGIIALLSQMELKGAHIVIPGAEEARAHLFTWLQEKGLSYERISLYRTLPKRGEPLKKIEDYDGFVFTSPSQVHVFEERYRMPNKNHALYAIGAITEKALRNSFSSALIIKGIPSEEPEK